LAQRQTLGGHIPPAVKKLNLPPVGRLFSTNRLHLAIGLPLRNQEALNTLLQEIYDPASPQYRHYLTPEQFTERFGPTKEDYQALIDYARANGFAVSGTYPNRVVLDADASVADIEKAFHLNVRLYQHPHEARTFYAPDAEPILDNAPSILHISGLDNYAIPRPRYVIDKSGATPNAIIPHAGTGSGPSGNFIGNDFRAAYVPGTALTGSGQNVGLLQFDGYTASDITYYETLAGLPNVTLTNVLIDGATGAPSGNGGEVEVSLDIEMVISMAPGVSKVILYMAPNPSPWPDLLSRMASDNFAKQISCSWGDNTAGSPDPTSEALFVQMATQGQSFFNASGDSDAFSGGIPFPSESTNVTQVGGTNLKTTGAGGSYLSETVWNDGGGVGSSGGISANFSIPPWQQGISMTANKGSTTMRNVPDVALTASNVYVRADGADQTNVRGTSCAAPLWAGFCALVNQQAAANGQLPVGFINPAVYAIGKGASYSNCFHDTTTGNNGTSTKYPAVSGYDLCTGWGTPNGANLINALAGAPTNAPALVASSAIVTGGNGNGVIDANECNLLNIVIQNIGAATATTVNATLSTTTPGVTITQPSVSYPNIAPNAFATNSPPFQVSTSPAFVCGTPVSLSLALSYAGGSATNVFSLPTCQCSGLQNNGGLSASSPTQTGRLLRNGTTSTCASAKSCPGYFATSGNYAYQAFSFTNTTGSAVCVTVTVSTACSGSGTTAIFSETYLGSFNPNSLCTSYLADLGSSPSGSAAYSFDVPANTNFTVVVNAVIVGPYCSSYTLSIAGLPCFVDGGGACAGISADFSGTPTNGTEPLLVTFTDTSSGTITNRFWDFGDSGTTNITTNSVVHTYAAGTYPVTLIVSGPGGSSTNTQANYITALTPFQSWQIQYFGCTNCPQAQANADPLGKGISNTNQFLLGLNPTNSASVFRIISIAQNTTDVVITWATGGVRTNAVEVTPGDVNAGYNTNSFQKISGSIIINITGDTTTNYTDAGGATNTPARYYRVRLVP
jgi:subtilase family serine protease